MKFSIVVPCYNEVENLPALISSYRDIVRNRTDIEVLIVNNGSTDNTAEVLAQLIPPEDSSLKVVEVPKNQGYGYGILYGLRAATGDFLGWTHGDLQTPPSDIIKAFDILETQDFSTSLFIKGTRVGRPLFDRFFTAGMSLFETLYLGTRLSDINAQPNVFHRSFFSSWQNPPHDFSLDLYVFYQAKKQNLDIVRFTVPFLKRQHGVSKWNTGLLSKWKFIKRTIKFSVELKRQLP